MHLSDTMPTLLLVKNATKQHNTLSVNDLGGYCAANNPFQLISTSVSTGLFKTYLVLSQGILWDCRACVYSKLNHKLNTIIK